MRISATVRLKSSDNRTFLTLPTSTLRSFTTVLPASILSALGMVR